MLLPTGIAKVSCSCSFLDDEYSPHIVAVITILPFLYNWYGQHGITRDISALFPIGPVGLAHFVTQFSPLSQGLLSKMANFKVLLNLCIYFLKKYLIK